MLRRKHDVNLDMMGCHILTVSAPCKLMQEDFHKFEAILEYNVSIMSSRDIPGEIT